MKWYDMAMQVSGFMAEADRRSLLTNLGWVLAQSMRYGSPLEEHRNFNMVGGSPAYEWEQVLRRNKKAQKFPLGMIVAMVDTAGKNIAEGIVSGVGIGERLEEKRLQPTDIVILVTKVFKPEMVVHKVLKDIIGECLHSTIQWPRRHVPGTRRFAIKNVEEAVRVFDFSKDPPGPQHQTPCSMEEGRSEMDSNDSPIPGFECLMTDGLLGPEVPRRPYQMLQRVATERRGNREIRKHQNKKVILESLQGAVRRSKCARKCLSKLSELMILTHRYEAWKSKSYAERRQWILQILWEAKVDPGEGGGRLTFAMKVNRYSVCNKCYADATGYSQRQFTNLKQSIRTHNISSSEHGSNRRSREHSNIATCQAVLDNFFQECGCSQPHQHAKQPSDGKYVPLVLLLMHT